MRHLIDPAVYAALRFRIYRYRFLLVYILIGLLSLGAEILILRGLNQLGVSFPAAGTMGVVSGILFAYWMNVRFNFKVPVAKRNRALAYFIGISAVSVSVNFLFKAQLLEHGWSYERARFVISGALFSFAYLLHRKFSFADRKQVGVAVYANGVEDIRGIREKIGDFPDFIHVDLIDSTFGPSHVDVRSYRLETIRAYWPKRAVHVHLMTRRPLSWLPDVLKYADLIIFHQEIDDSIEEVIQQIHTAGKRAGMSLLLDTPVADAHHWISKLDVLMLLTITTPGQSGQKFQHEAALGRVEQINRWPERAKFKLCVDGGVSEQNIHLLNVELAVSGSSVLSADNPSRQIMRLQTCNNHEAL